MDCIRHLRAGAVGPRGTAGVDTSADGCMSVRVHDMGLCLGDYADADCTAIVEGEDGSGLGPGGADDPGRGCGPDTDAAVEGLEVSSAELEVAPPPEGFVVSGDGDGGIGIGDGGSGRHVYGRYDPARSEAVGDAADAGRGFVSVKPWLGAIRDAAPSGWNEKYSHLSQKLPRKKLELEHVYGYKTRDVRQNCKWVDDDTLVFFAGCIGVVQDTSNQRQYFYLGHTSDICSLAFNEKLALVATGGLGDFRSSPICIWSIDQATATTKHHKEIRSPVMQQAVVQLAFSPDGTRLVGVGADFNHTIGIFSVRSGALLTSIGTPGRNPLYDVEFFSKRFCDSYRAPGWGGRLDPDDHFVTAGWKHIYIWSFERGSTSTVQKVKGRLQPYLKHGRRVTPTELGQESFSGIAFGVHHLIVTAMSSTVYLFKIDPPAGDGCIKTFVMYHAIVLNKHVPASRVGRSDSILDVMQAATSMLVAPTTTGLRDELTRFGLALLAGFPSNSSEAHASRKLISIIGTKYEKFVADAQTALEDALDAAGDGALNTDPDALRKHALPFCRHVRKALSVLEEVQALVQAVWVQAIQRGYDMTGAMRDIGIPIDGEGGGAPPAAGFVRRGSAPPHATPDGKVRNSSEYADTFLQQRVRWTQRLQRCVLQTRELSAAVARRIKQPGKMDMLKKPKAAPVGPDDGIICLRVYDGRYVITGGADGYISFYDLYPGAPQPWRADMAQAVLEDDVRQCLEPLWEYNLNEQCTATLASTDPSNCVRAVDVTPDRAQLTVGTMTGSVYVMDLSTSGVSNIYGEVEAHFGPLPASAEGRKQPSIGPDGYGECWGLSPHPVHPWVATCADDSTLRVWDTSMRAQISCRFLPLQPLSCQMSTDGHIIAVGCRNGAFGLFAAQSLTRLWPLEGEDFVSTRYRRFPVHCVRFSPDGRYLAVAIGCYLDVYRLKRKSTHAAVEQGQVVAFDDVAYFGTCTGASGSLFQIDWSQDSTLIQVASKSYEVLFFDISLRRNKRIAQLTHGPSVADVKWTTFTSPFGWSVQGVFPKYAGGSDVNVTARSNGGSLVVTGDDQFRVTVFNYPCVGGEYDSHGRLVSRPQNWAHYGHASHVTNVCWLGNDSRVLSVGGADCVVAQWRVVDAPDHVPPSQAGGTGPGIARHTARASDYADHPLRPKRARDAWHPPTAAAVSPGSSPKGGMRRKASYEYALGADMLSSPSVTPVTSPRRRRMSVKAAAVRRMSYAGTCTDRARRADMPARARPATAEVPGGRKPDRPKCKEWLEKTRGAVHRPNFIYRNRQMLNMQRRQAFEARQRAQPDIFSQTAPVGGAGASTGSRGAKRAMGATDPGPRRGGGGRKEWDDDNLERPPRDSEDPHFGDPMKRSGIPRDPDGSASSKGRVPVRYEDMDAKRPRHGPRSQQGRRGQPVEPAGAAHPLAKSSPPTKGAQDQPPPVKSPASSTSEGVPRTGVFRHSGFGGSSRASSPTVSRRGSGAASPRAHFKEPATNEDTYARQLPDDL